MTKTITDQAVALLRAGRARDALAVIQPVADAPDAPLAAVGLCAAALRACGRRREALDYDRRIVEADPNDAKSWLAMGATLLLAGHYLEAGHAAEQARRLGGDGPVAQLLLARALSSRGEGVKAEAVLQEGLMREPEHAELHRELAQLVWMRTGDADQAMVALDRARAERPGSAGLIAVRAAVMDLLGRHAQAWAELRILIERGVAAAPVDLIAADLALKASDREGARKLAARAAKYAPNDPIVLQRLCRVLLSTGDAAQALVVARELVTRSPGDPTNLALLSTASRAAADGAEHRRLYDYGLVRTYRIEAPAGWRTVEAFLADVNAALDRLPRSERAPLFGSLRDGSQTLGELLAADDPALLALFQAFDAPIRQYVADLGQGPDPVRAANTGHYAITAASATRLGPNGRHLDRVQPGGWLSAAFFVETSVDAADETRSGWLRFGHPEMPVRPPLEAEHHVRPEAGLLVLFPSYMWHGTVPVADGGSQTTVAFDLSPA